MKTYTCEQCGVEFSRDYYPASTPRFCTRRCYADFRKRRVKVECPQCGKINERKRSHSARVFCDQSCYGQHRAAHPELYPAPQNTPELAARLSDARRGAGNPMYGRTGDRSPHWKGGRIGDRGRGWRTIRKLVRRRDGDKCVICGKAAEDASQLDVHHIFDWAETECNHPHNLITVCGSCHQGTLHGNAKAPTSHQLVALARDATLYRLAPGDLPLLLRLDRQQRAGKGFQQFVVDALGLPPSYLSATQQLPLPSPG